MKQYYNNITWKLWKQILKKINKRMKNINSKKKYRRMEKRDRKSKDQMTDINETFEI